jgi:uncharacterized membrane protein required for colicin V production
VDIAGFIRSAPMVDLVIVFAFFGCFVAGVAQGTIRRLLGLMAMVFSFLFAASLRGVVGDFFADNWRQFDSGYNHLLAFLLIFVVGSVASSIVIQGFYKRTELNADHPIVDDVVGGLIGVLQGAFILLVVVIILNSYILPPAQSGDVTQLRDAQNAIVNQSHIAAVFRDVVAPPFVHLLSFFLPSDLVARFP